jgi:prephenate dehydrogenase
LKIAIIGGYGRMGRWFADFLKKDGKEVVVAGRNEKKLLEVKKQLGVAITTSNAEAVRGVDAVLISVPVDSFDGVVREIAPHTHPGQSILDVTSVKVSPVESMHRHIKAGVVLGAHPVFGPGARGVANQNFVLTPTSEEEEALARKVRQYLEAKEARVTLMSPREHDELMSVVLGLAHFIAIVSADTLLSAGNLKKTRAVGGITYKMLLTLVESVISEDVGLYASIQMNLAGVKEVENLFRSKAESWAELVAGGDRQQFVRRMTALKSILAQDTPDFGKAYEDIYRIVEGL